MSQWETKEERTDRLEAEVRGLRKIVAELRARGIQPEPVSGWRPISEHDGGTREVVVYRVQGNRNGRACCLANCYAGVWYAGGKKLVSQPTYWMPLPAAPDVPEGG